MLCVQWKTPDDGQRNCPKHAEFHSKIIIFEKLVHLVGFTIRNLSWCMATWTSNFTTEFHFHTFSTQNDWKKKSNVKWSHLLNDMIHCFNSYTNFKLTHYHSVQNVGHRLSLKSQEKQWRKCLLIFRSSSSSAFISTSRLPLLANTTKRNHVKYDWNFSQATLLVLATQSTNHKDKY